MINEEAVTGSDGGETKSQGCVGGGRGFIDDLGAEKNRERGVTRRMGGQKTEGEEREETRRQRVEVS